MAAIREIAEWVGADDPGITGEVVEVAGFDDAGPGAVVFAVDEAALAMALATKAGVVLANAKLRGEESHADSRILWVQDARYAFAVVARRFKVQGFVAEVHPTAVIGKGVALGEGTRIGPGAVIEDGASIGRDCNLVARVVVHAGTVIGDRVIVQAGAVLGSTGFGYVRGESGEYLMFPQQGRLVVEDDVEIGANTTIDRGALSETRIGRGTKIDNLVHIGHNCVIGKNVVIAAQTGISGSSVVEDGAILGGQVGIGEHATVGRGVILGGGAGVLSGKKMHGEGEVFWGRPARPLKEYLKDLARLKKR